MECRFCNGDKIQKEVLFETENFFIVPALGSFIPYYLLIISKKHTGSLSQIFAEDHSTVAEFTLIRQKIDNFINETYKKPSFCFEHGSLNDNMLGSGCCVYHCHIHILPQEKPLGGIMRQQLGACQTTSSYSDINNIISKDDNSYLFLEEDSKIKIWRNKKVISQYIRRVLANQCQLDKKYDWKQFPFYEEMQHTTEAWKKWQTKKV
jgi:diadenosine tetraphosphate (Ap4A) HIT family hydrolase